MENPGRSSDGLPKVWSAAIRMVCPNLPLHGPVSPRGRRWLGLLVGCGGGVSVAEAAFEPMGTMADAGVWIVGTLAIAAAAGAGAWFAGRRAGQRLAQNERQLSSVLEFADCLLWQAVVTLDGPAWKWDVKVQPTKLTQRVFARERPPEIAGLWQEFEVPERAEMDRRCRAALEEGNPGYEQEFHVVRGGQVIWLRESVTISRLAPGRFSLVGLVTDITAQRQIETVRRENEDRLRQLLSRADCMLWQARVSSDAKGALKWEWFIPDSELFRRLGGTREPEVQMPWDKTLVPEFAEINQRSWTAMRSGAKGYEQEFRVVRDNRVTWLHEQVTIEHLGPNEWRLEGMTVDITGQRQAEESKQASEQQLQQVVRTADFMLWHARIFQQSKDRFHWVLTVPDSTLFRQVFGTTPTVPGEMPWRTVMSEEAFREMERRSHASLVRGEDYEQEISARRDGTEFWLHEQASVQTIKPGEWLVVGIVTDVTTRHRAEEARRGSERALREILERANCLLWRATVRRTGTGMEWVHFELPASRLFTELCGGKPAGPSDRLWELANVPELAEMNARSTRAVLEGESGYEQQFRATAAGRSFWLHEQVTITPSGPETWGLVGVITDVTQQQDAIEARRKSEGRLEELMQRADCLIWQGRVNGLADGRFDWKVYVPRSRLYRRIFGREAESNGLAWNEAGVPEYDEMMQRCEQALSGRARGYEQVFHVPKPEGDIWLSEQVSISPAGENQWDCVGVITDISALKAAEDARRSTEAQLQSLLELADCMVWEATVQERATGELDWSLFTPRSVLYRRLFGEDEMAAKLEWGRLEVPEFPQMEARAREALRTRAPGYEQEFRVVQLHRVLWMREVVTITPIAPDRFRLVGVITDITAQREAQEAHRASLAQIDQMLAGAECMLWQARVFEIEPGDMRWVMFIPPSRLYRELFGGDPGNPAYLPWDDVLDQETKESIHRRSTSALYEGVTSYEQDFRAQRGDRVFWLHEAASITAVGPGEWQVVGVMTDLTERRAAEQSVRDSELRYRTLYQHAPVAIVEADFAVVGQWLGELRSSGVTDLRAWLEADRSRLVEAARRVRIIDCNDTAMVMLKAKSRADFRRRRGALATGDAMRMVRDVTMALWDGRNRIEAEVDMFDFEGGLHHMNLRWWMERGEKGLDHGQSVMTLVDLTELKRAEAALAAEKERLAVTLRAMAEGVITTDVDGRVQFMNEAAVAFTGCEAASSIGRPVAEVCCFANDRTGEAVEVPVPRVAQGDVVVELPPRTRMTARDATSRLVEGCCAPIHSAASRVIGTVLVFRDVTEHERLEQELVRATKLESVGILAGGIAHDFNNILTAVMGNVALAALDLDPNSDAGRSLAEAEKATLRARDLTQQLLTFAKGGEPVRAAVRLDGVVREIAGFTLHGSKVRAQFEFGPGLWAADADKGQIGRVVQNLVLNAVQAMPEGGTVRIALRNDRVEGLGNPALVPGDYVRIEISDQGTGIRPEHLARIFDPYFTTKQKGSGLGLAAVYSIVSKHRGTIDVTSQLGQGTTFRIWLPASLESVAADGAAGGTAQPVAMTGRVLFMDDEEPIRQMATFLLRRFGFEVECSIDGADAVERFRRAREQGQPFALVIVDLTVPGGMGGREAVAKMREIDPRVRAIVSSGYSSDPVLAKYREHGFCGVAAKPYEVGDLARVLREALAS